MTRVGLGALALGMLVLATPASASTFEFFEGNNCTQAKLGGINVEKHVEYNRDQVDSLVRGSGWISTAGWNDEVRSVLVTSNWQRTREPVRSVVVVYDSPDKKTTDDWARIIVSDATKIPPQGVCIGSFERNFDRHGVYLERHPDNGLDGKISSIVSICNAACRSNLTPDPNAPAVAPKPRLITVKRDPNRKTLSPEAARILKRGSKK